MQTFPVSIRLILILAMVGTLICGCSGSNDPVVPLSEPGDTLSIETGTPHSNSGHYLWAYYFISIDPGTLEYEVVPVRIVSTHWNVLSWLEFGPCTNCFTLVNITPSGTGTILADIRIKHPFTGANLTGFDVRGIPIFDGSEEFAYSEWTYSDRYEGDGELVNADGYTTLYSEDTAGMGPGGLQGYITGKLATNEIPDSLLNGYKRHISNDPANTRNAFYAGDTVTVTYEVDMPDGPFVFGYAVDASWATPVTKPVTNPMTDFGLDANCLEPWKIAVSGLPIGASGSTELTIDVYDWEGTFSHYPPQVECSELFTGTIPASHTMDGTGFSRWVVTVENSKGAGIGDYRCLISVEDHANNPSGTPWLDLTAYQMFYIGVTVGPSESGWARTWGGVGLDRGSGVAVDSSGNIYVAGCFDYYMEFNFPEGDDIYFLDPETPDQSYLCKFGPSGAYIWSRVWGSPDTDRANAVAVDASGNIYVGGQFEGTADFDPGAGVESRTSYNIWSDAYLSKFDPSGNLLWVRTWGGADDDEVYGVAVDFGGSVMAIGEFEESVDFDPGTGNDTQYSSGYADVFLSRFDSSGNFKWARTWGGPSSDTGADVTGDESGYIYATGYFSDTVDFDPGSGSDIVNSNDGSVDVWFIKFDSAGGYQWVKTWGGTAGDTGRGITANGYGSVFVTGLYGSTVDFNPGAGSDEHTSNGDQDVYVSMFDTSGNFDWARTWGSSQMDYGNEVAADADGNVYVTGLFRLTIDFDPGGGVDNHTAEYYDIFLSKFNAFGVFQWANTWGGDTWDEGYSVALNSYGNPCITGDFKGSDDFDPGPGEDWHTSADDEDGFLIKLLSNGFWN